MPTNVETPPKGAPALDPSLLAVASLASVCSAVVASAIGTGPVATLVVAAVSPWIVAFISYPGRRRHRRVGAVLLLAGLVHGARAGLARAASYVRHPRDRERRRARERSTQRSAVGHSVPRRLSRVATTTIGAVGVAAVCLTVPELVLGAAVVADRPLTLLPVAEHRVDGPGTHPNPPAGSHRAGPTLSVPGGGVRRLATGPRGARVTYRVVARDSHGAALTPECRPGSGRLFAVGETRVTCVARQANGLSVRRSFTVTVVGVKRPGGGHADANAPHLITPGHIVREIASHGAVRVTFAVSALDAADGPLTPSCDPPSGALFAEGDTRVSCSATDSAGNTRRASFTVTVRHAEHPGPPDKEPPHLSLPGTVHAQASTSLGAIVTYAARAVDVRDGASRIKCLPASGTRFAVGRTRVTCSATDRAGNTAGGGFAVFVSPVPDRIAPRIAAPRFVRGEATSRDGAVIRYAATATDDRDGRVPVTCSPASGSTFRVGVTRVKCSASDRAGNVATRSFAVVVMRGADASPDPGPRPGGGSGGGGDHPTPTPTPAEPDRTAPEIGRFWIRPVVADTMKGATVTFRTPTATDDRDGPVPVECKPASGSWFDVGTATVTCSAEDKAGNTATRSATARVYPPPDREAPHIDPFRIQEVTAETREGAVVTYETPSATDDRDGPVTPECDPPSGSRFPVGSSPVTCTARDRAGNTATLVVTATVNPPPTPPDPGAEEGPGQTTP